MMLMRGGSGSIWRSSSSNAVSVLRKSLTTSTSSSSRISRMDIKSRIFCFSRKRLSSSTPQQQQQRRVDAPIVGGRSLLFSNSLGGNGILSTPLLFSSQQQFFSSENSSTKSKSNNNNSNNEEQGEERKLACGCDAEEHNGGATTTTTTTNSINHEKSEPSSDYTNHFEPVISLVREDPQRATSELLSLMNASEREVLMTTLREIEAKEHLLESSSSSKSFTSTVTVQDPTTQQQILYALQNGIPFIGFGFMDNFLMIIFGEGLDATLGVAFGFSTMAAAGLGNLFSDCVGVLAAGAIQSLSAVLKIRDPGLTQRQMKTKKARMAATWGNVLGCGLGCLIGLFPLLLMDTSKREQEKVEIIHSRSSPSSSDPPPFNHLL